MACAHDHDHQDAAHAGPGWRRALWIALVLNLAMFVVEIVAGVSAGSAALLADSLDFFGDAATYAISLLVAGMALVWRARAAYAKGVSILVFGGIVIVAAIHRVLIGEIPHAPTMGAVALLAFAVNLAVAFLLYRWREGDANMRSVWICTRNDVIGNAAVLAAAAGVFGMGSYWPDVIVAAIMAGLGIFGGVEIVRRAQRELKPPPPGFVARESVSGPA